MDTLFVFGSLTECCWYGALQRLARALETTNKPGAATHYRELFRCLAEEGFPDAATALADALVYGTSALADQAAAVPPGLLAGALCDLKTLAGLAQRDWAQDTGRLLGQSLPALACLAPEPSDTAIQSVSEALRAGEPQALLASLLHVYRQQGAGELARYQALCWSPETRSLRGIEQPARPDPGRLVDLDRPLDFLRRNTEAFLAGKPAQHTLLYGPRGSGKSTAVKSLLTRYGEHGLRLVELPPAALPDLAEVTRQLRARPQRYLLFVDDLSYEADSAHYGPLKTLLEGSLAERPANVLIYATSNRRHLLRERFSDRPDPLDDDVHGWDSLHEKLALADRFGLTITFPDTSQARYLQIVRQLADREGLQPPDLEQRAVRFADWGNGYSGRTAQQFIETLTTERA